jgi:DNA-binding NarL/FixJ family response regulator
MALRTLLADDHSLVRAGLRSLLEEMAGVEVVGEAADGHEALRLIGELTPDVAFLDISMPGLNGLEVAARAAREHLRTRVIILSMHIDDEYVRRALLTGAAGYLLKSSDRSELEMALRAVARGETWLAPEVSSRVVAAYARGDEPAASGPFELLTERQREVLQFIAEGLSTKEIAHRLNLSVKTIETHRTELMERLDIHGVAGLVRYAIRVGIVHTET